MIFLNCQRLVLSSKPSGHPEPSTGDLGKAFGLPECLSGKESACQCKRCRFDPWVGKSPLE